MAARPSGWCDEPMEAASWSDDQAVLGQPIGSTVCSETRSVSPRGPEGDVFSKDRFKKKKKRVQGEGETGWEDANLVMSLPDGGQEEDGLRWRGLQVIVHHGREDGAALVWRGNKTTGHRSGDKRQVETCGEKKKSWKMTREETTTPQQQQQTGVLQQVFRWYSWDKAECGRTCVDAVLTWAQLLVDCGPHLFCLL